MKYICAQPAIQYFGWQIDVLLYSFKNVGVNLEDVHVICAIHGEIDPYFDTLMKKYPGVLFSFYEDTREYRDYIPSIKQHLLYKHYSAFPELENETIFLIDADICLTKPIDFSGLLDDNVWYVSDTVSYLGYDYIKSKGKDIMDAMFKYGGISEDIVKSMNNAAGGAQYLYKNVKKEFWKEVVDVSHEIYKNVSVISEEKKQRDEDYFPIQIWTAEMWAMLWVAWKKGIMTSVHRNLDFCWATDPVEKWHQTSIFHNAGVTDAESGMFFKGKYIDNFPDLNLDISKDKCSYRYYGVLQQALV
jgi:hypothetical protein